MSYCQNCGGLLDEAEMNFCPFCGSSLHKVKCFRCGRELEKVSVSVPAAVPRKANAFRKNC